MKAARLALALALAAGLLDASAAPALQAAPPGPSAPSRASVTCSAAAPAARSAPRTPAPARPPAGPCAPSAPPARPAQDSAAAALGGRLFFDRRLSANGSMSCAMCHVPEQGFASNASQRAVGLQGRSLQRNAPSLLNVAARPLLFWDGRASALAEQAWLPLLHADEMGNASAGAVIARIRALPDYRGRFERAFAGHGASRRTVGQALAAFQATLVATDSRVDRWLATREPVLSPREQAGYRLFTGRAQCAQCHPVGAANAPLADGRFHVTGAGLAPVPALLRVELAPGVHTELAGAALAGLVDPLAPDLGRHAVTHDPRDRHAFRTPDLRDVARTAPYMHDGSLGSLEAVVEFYAQGGGTVEGKSPLLAPLALSDEDKAALVAFLRALDSGTLPALVQRVRSGIPARRPRPVLVN